MQKLEERMLGVVAGLAPDDRSRLPLRLLPIKRHGLAVAFHLELLQVGREAAQPVVVWEDRESRQAQKVDVPDSRERHENWQILVPWRGAEMLIHRVPTAEQGQEVLLPDGDSKGHADGGPQRIASPDPVPHLEAVLRMH